MSSEASEVNRILELQSQIEERLRQLGFVDDADAIGNIEHHLAEAAVFGEKLASNILPRLLSLPLDKRQEIAELVVDLQYDFLELRDSLEDMEPALVKLMNFLTR